MNDQQFRDHVIRELAVIGEKVKIIDEHTHSLKEITDLLNKVKGGWLTLAACSSFAGAFGSWIYNHFKH